MSLFRLTFNTVLNRKTFIIFLVLLIVLPLALPFLTPWEEKPQLLEPARAQTAWSLLWMVALGWVLYQAASFGDHCASQGVLEYFKTLGTKRLAQLAQLWLTCQIFFFGFLAVVLVLTLLTAMPSDSVEARAWVLTNLQYAWLFSLVFSPLVCLAIALGTRFNTTVAYLLTAGIAAYGLFGIGYLDFFLSQSGNPVLDLLFILSPHYHLADLTARLVFKMGAMAWGSFLTITAYLTGLGLLIVALASLLYREKK